METKYAKIAKMFKMGNVPYTYNGTYLLTDEAAVVTDGKRMVIYRDWVSRSEDEVYFYDGGKMRDSKYPLWKQCSNHSGYIFGEFDIDLADMVLSNNMMKDTKNSKKIAMFKGKVAHFNGNSENLVYGVVDTWVLAAALRAYRTLTGTRAKSLMVKMSFDDNDTIIIQSGDFKMVLKGLFRNLDIENNGYEIANIELPLLIKK